MVQQNSIERLGEERDAELLGMNSINWMLAKVLLLTTYCLLDRNLVDNLLLGSALDSIVPKLKWVNISLEKIKRVCAFVHEVDLGQNANSPFPRRVHFPREF